MSAQWLAGRVNMAQARAAAGMHACLRACACTWGNYSCVYTATHSHVFLLKNMHFNQNYQTPPVDWYPYE